MNLDYDILWIDDRPKQIQNAIEHVRIKLARKGFELNVKTIERVDSKQSLARHFNQKEYDLLVVDYQMQQNAETGDNLIRHIRSFCDTTDIVFYSSERPTELRSKIDVDGVFCVNRENLPEKLDHVIHSTIKKALDLNNMRGIALSTLADFDCIIDELIEVGYSKLSKETSQQAVIAAICNTAGNYHRKSFEKIEAIDKQMSIADYLSLLSSQPKFEVLSQIIEQLNAIDLDTCLDRTKDYSRDIIQPRNQLAHSMLKEFSNGEYVLTNKKRDLSFSQNDFNQLRIKLIEYRELFEQMKRIVSDL